MCGVRDIMMHRVVIRVCHRENVGVVKRVMPRVNVGEARRVRGRRWRHLKCGVRDVIMHRVSK